MEIRDAFQLEKAKLEDILIELLYSKYNDLVFHGDTSIWRCYNGNRYSRDLDFYIKATSSEDKRQHYKRISDFLKELGFSLKEKGYSKSTDTMHFLVESNAKMKVDMNFRYKKGTRAEYKKIDDSKIVVLALTPSELLEEKIITYNDKMANTTKIKQPEVQDLYDIYHLVSIIEKGDKKTVTNLRSLIGKIKDSPPPNMSSLDHLVLVGLPPSLELMLDRINRWLDDNS